MEMWRCVDVEMCRCGDMEMWKCGDVEMCRCGDVLMWRCGDLDLKLCLWLVEVLRYKTKKLSVKRIPLYSLLLL